MFGKDPVQIFIEDVHLLVESSAHTTSSAEEDEERVQRAKIERLYNAELLHLPEDDAGTLNVAHTFCKL
jgi:vacuolar protein sorting-associated protein 13A/C